MKVSREPEKFRKGLDNLGQRLKVKRNLRKGLDRASERKGLESLRKKATRDFETEDRKRSEIFARDYRVSERGANRSKGIRASEKEERAA